ncbi:MAG: hypothetical protein HC913_23870 [Microscillaceae bacterium]|nr:hypothetical protein [Microscillaceae bacterium]
MSERKYFFAEAVQIKINGKWVTKLATPQPKMTEKEKQAQKARLQKAEKKLTVAMEQFMAKNTGEPSQ